jgi:hypothetical protein
MSPETLHCGICGKPIYVKNFADGMSKLRHHRQKYHPKAFKESVKKAVATRKKNK